MTVECEWSVIEENSSQNNKEGSERSAIGHVRPPGETPIDKTGGKPKVESSDEKEKLSRKLLVEIVKDDELKPFEKETLALTRRTLRLTVWAVVIAAIGAAFVLGQLQQMTWNNQILSSQSESAVASTIESERNTRAQIRAMQDQVDAIQRQMRIDERAWVGVKGTKLSFEKAPTGAARLACWVEIVNTGKTFAIDTTVVGTVDTRHKPADIDQFMHNPPSPTTTGSRTILMPGGVIILNLSSPTFLYPEDVHAIEEGSAKFLYIFGSIKYLDVFGYKHTTHYCTFYKDGGPKDCPTGNWTDSDLE